MAGPVLRLEVDGIDELARHFEHLPGVVAKAERRALKRTSKWAQSQGRKAMSHASGIQQKGLRRRMRAMVYGGGDGQVRIWFGTDDIPAGYVGTPRQQKKGAKVGKHKFPGAFVATMKSGHASIFERQGKSRLPIFEHYVEVIMPDDEFDRIAVESESKLLKEFHHNLEYYAGKLHG